ncbi:unnamed protein product [Meloidogyne enterolobii]|uniref:Uncharacterized protein n=1 Tax=Meloidogyne enterolobii TaxID=390850 RepID=A0ACB1A779_MELEN
MYLEIHVRYPSAPHGNTSVYFPPAHPSGENPNVTYPPYHGAPHHGTNGENFQNLNGDRAPTRRGGNQHGSYLNTYYLGNNSAYFEGMREGVAYL